MLVSFLLPGPQPTMTVQLEVWMFLVLNAGVRL